MELLERAEHRRVDTLGALQADDQAALGQYFTPFQAARIIADLPRVPDTAEIRILDPGAGSGILTAALVERIRAHRPASRIHVTAVEMDPGMTAPLRETLNEAEAIGNVTTEIVVGDFVAWALESSERFDIVIQNPPYAKLPTGSSTQKALRAAGIDVPNIYAAFLALGVRLLNAGGQQVAITPRSWMNGKYYESFRRAYVETAGIDSIHTFESRSKVFGDTGVLQEAIVVSVTVGFHPDHVSVYTSQDHREEASSRSVPYQDVVTADFIHVPATSRDADAVAWVAEHCRHTLADLGLTVSTGRVVDFRSREMLHHERSKGASPMVNATHIRSGIVRHPVGAKKPEWFETEPDVAAKLLVPAGAYVLVKRFSAKEERRRVVAAVWESDEAAAFDNKLNYVHSGGQGIDVEIARGLAVYLNSTRLDDYFRVFSGHTQVNATDLRQMRFPSASQLRELAAADIQDQTTIDTTTESVLAKIEVAA